MQRRMGDDVSVPELAQAVNLSRSRFAHLFKQETGVSPARYLRDQRLDRARDLLERTFLSVKEVMAQVGFNDPSHFSRDFQRIYGASPRGWRRKIGRAPPDHGPAVHRDERHLRSTTGMHHRMTGSRT
jgi:transcriptional regulator GlxA family with amidase domain